MQSGTWLALCLVVLSFTFVQLKFLDLFNETTSSIYDLEVQQRELIKEVQRLRYDAENIRDSDASGDADTWNAYAHKLGTGLFSRLKTEIIGRWLLQRDWASREYGDLIAKKRAVYYPFGGPDIANAMTYFPGAPKYILFGQSPVGPLKFWSEFTEEEQKQVLNHTESALLRLAKINYFTIKDQEEHLTEDVGVLPILLAQIYLNQKRIVSVRHVRIGGTQYNNAVSIEAISETGEQQVIEYWSIDARQEVSYFYQYLDSMVKETGKFTTMMKATGCLMFQEFLPEEHILGDFNTMRKHILSVSCAILQDDTSIPYRDFLGKVKWNVQHYGSYIGPPHFKDGYGVWQPELFRAVSAAIDKQQLRPMPFRFGYLHRVDLASQKGVKKDFPSGYKTHFAMLASRNDNFC